MKIWLKNDDYLGIVNCSEIDRFFTKLKLRITNYIIYKRNGTKPCWDCRNNIEKNNLRKKIQYYVILNKNGFESKNNNTLKPRLFDINRW